MATTLEQVIEYLDSEGLKHRREDNFVRLGFETSNYRAPSGDSGISLVIALEEDGEFIKIVAPSIYQYPDGPHKAVLFQLLLMISWNTKMVQYEYDTSDGEVRAIIEFPLEDATLTKKQLMRCLQAIAQLVDEYHPKVVTAMTKGELPSLDDEQDMAALWAEFQVFLEQKRRAEETAGHGLPE
jgi:hypothetical protein